MNHIENMFYEEFIRSKAFHFEAKGIEVNRGDLHPYLKPHQLDITKWALKKGKSAIFGATGSGKTAEQSEWGKQVAKHTDGCVLMLAPLAVASQTVREGKKLDLNINFCRQQSDVKSGLNITNYEMLHKFNPDIFDGGILDESSILKSDNGAIRNGVIDFFKYTPFRLACTATPSPNDYMELGNHAEFLGVMSRTEMLSMFFVHDGGETQKWRLKGHAESKFWEWVSSWAVMFQKPSDLGYDDEGYILPPLNIIDHVVKVDRVLDGVLIAEEAKTLQERQQARRDSIDERVAKCAEIVNATDKPFLVWCNLNTESEMLTKLIDGAVEVKGSDSPEHKAKSMIDFTDGKIRVLVSKTKICGFGMNWQHCSEEAFVGLTDSYESVFQAIRRCWRYGQKNPVNVHMIVSDLEGAVSENLKRKEKDFENMIREMLKYTKRINGEDVQVTTKETTEYKPQVVMRIPSWLRSEVS